MAKRPKKGSKTWAMWEADRLFSLIIRSAGACKRCDSRVGLQCAHLISRSYKAIRTDLGNAMCLCQKCHMYFTHHPLEWEEWVCEHPEFGRAHWNRLRRKALGYRKVDWFAEIETLARLWEQIGEAA